MSRWTLDEAMKNPVIREALRKDTARTMKQTGVADTPTSPPISLILKGDGVKGPPNPSPRSFSFEVYGKPISLNHAFPTGKHGRRFPAPEYLAWKKQITVAAGEARPLEGEVSVRLRFFFPSRRADLDNHLKPVLDALTGVLYGDDRQVVRIEAEREVDKCAPRVEVTVSRAERGEGGK